MELRCPHCKTAFQVDENDYAAILAQVKTAEFEKEVRKRINELLAASQSEQRARELEAEKQEAQRLSLKDKEIAALKAKVENMQTQHQLDIVNERNSCRDDLHAKEQAIVELESQLKAQEVAAANKLLELKEHHSAMLKAKEEEIEHYKDLKSRLSTKMLGETLEQHCQNTFNMARSMGQFADAYFEKDNDAAGGTKGDFIFRDYIDGNECISIMFEMKNEAETTSTKHKNEDFFAKLDKDRNDKKCE